MNATARDIGGKTLRPFATGRDEAEALVFHSPQPTPVFDPNAKYVEQLEKRIEEKDA